MKTWYFHQLLLLEWFTFYSVPNSEKQCSTNSDGRQGWLEWAPYDAIHVGAAAPEIPKPLTDQLKPGGRMVIPVGDLLQELKVVDKKLDGSVTVQTVASVRYVPLTSRDVQLQD